MTITLPDAVRTPQPGAVPMSLGEDGRALGQHGLLVVVLRHGAAGVEPLKVGLDAAGGGRVEHQLFAEALGQHVFGQIVAGGAQAAGGNENVRPAFGQLHRGPQPLGVVAHHRVVVDVDAQGRQALGEHLASVLAMLPSSNLVPTAISSAV